MSICNRDGAVTTARLESRATCESILPRAATRALCLIAFSLIGGCGGGGGDGAPGTDTGGAAATVTVGGTISGLIGTVVLQDNGSDSLSVGANGAFTFPTAINNGATYNVTILTQPPGPTCVVSNGSGTAAADVTSISVTCTTDPSTVFLPFKATPEQNSSGGTTGLFVISSKSLDGKPIPVESGDTTVLGFSLQLALDSSGNLTGGNPYSLTYITVNSPGGDHVWTLDLEGTSALVPTQLSNLTLPTQPAPQHCSGFEILKDLKDPRSAFFILELSTDTANGCSGAPSFRWVLVRATDGPTTTPAELPTISTPILPLYHPSGTLAGLVSLDGSHNLNFYQDETFTNPVHLLTNVASFSPWQAPRVSSLSNLSTQPGYAFLVVQSLPNATDALYRVDDTGTVSADLYDFQGGYDNGILLDSNNLYFTDTAQTESIVQVAGSGGPAQILYSESGKRIFIYGVTQNNLVLQTAHGLNPQTGLTTTDIETLRIGVPGTPTTIASYDSPASISLSGGDVFVTVTTGPAPGGPYSYSSEIRDISGASIQPLMAQSSFISLSAPIMQLRNITDASGIGGGSIYALDLSSPTNPTGVPLKLSSGAVFKLPAGTSTAALQGEANNVGTGGEGVGNQFLGLAYDVTKGVIAPIAIPNTNVFFVSSPN